MTTQPRNSASGASPHSRAAGRARVVLAARLAAITGLLCLGTAGFVRAAGTFYVDNANSSCSNSGPGSAANPYCSIVTALTKQGGPGTTILVKPGTYREQVTVPASGVSGSPLEIRALGPVIIDGSNSFASPGLWVVSSGDVWLAASVTWAPFQVFTDGTRLAPSTAAPGALPPGTFEYVPGTGLFVNAGGGNPGNHGAIVGRRLNGFLLNGRSWVNVEGFDVIYAEEKGIELSGSDNCEILGNNVTNCFSNGISLFASADVRVAGNRVSDNVLHGISLRGGTSASTVEDNVSARNHDDSPALATGIYLAGSPDNLIQRNRVFGNEDSGIEIQSGSSDCVSLQNIAYENGDHGFEQLFASGTVNIGNVAWGNHTDGFSIEGQSAFTSLFDCIAVNNGLGIGEFDLYVDSSSTMGLASDYNIFWNSTSQRPIKYNGVQYLTIAAYHVASGQDANSIQADPLFFDAAGGNFHPLPGSPAIDSGTSGVLYWPSTDAQGVNREDDAATPNTGAGGVPYTDRGAFEYRPSTTGVGDAPGGYRISLSSPMPNPSRGPVSFVLTLSRDTRAEWNVFDLQGRRLGGGSEWHPAGRSVVSWSGANNALPVSGGVRFMRLEVDGQSFSRRFVQMP